MLNIFFYIITKQALFGTVRPWRMYTSARVWTVQLTNKTAPPWDGVPRSEPATLERDGSYYGVS